MTLDGRDAPPSLTPPPRTVTLPPSYGVIVGVVEEVVIEGVAPVTVAGVLWIRSLACGVLGEGVRPRMIVSSTILAISVEKTSAEPGREPGVNS
jgi:hypothetical protein